MKVLEKGTMPNGTAIQIEEWHEDYNFMPYGRTIASYPKSKVSHEGAFSPKGNQIFRCEFDFTSHKEAKEIYNNLLNGIIQLSDLKANIYNPKYADCL